MVIQASGLRFSASKHSDPEALCLQLIFFKPLNVDILILKNLKFGSISVFILPASKMRSMAHGFGAFNSNLGEITYRI